MGPTKEASVLVGGRFLSGSWCEPPCFSWNWTCRCKSYICKLSRRNGPPGGASRRGCSRRICHRSRRSRAFHLCAFWNAPSVACCRWILSGTRCTRRAFLLCESSCGSPAGLIGWTFWSTRRIYEDALLCVCACACGACQSAQMLWNTPETKQNKY